MTKITPESAWASRSQFPIPTPISDHKISSWTIRSADCPIGCCHEAVHLYRNPSWHLERGERERERTGNSNGNDEAWEVRTFRLRPAIGNAVKRTPNSEQPIPMACTRTSGGAPEDSKLQGMECRYNRGVEGGRRTPGAMIEAYKPRDHQDVLEVENATSRRRADCGADIRPFSVSTIWLEVEELSAPNMADWSWESANASSSKQAAPMQSSPLQSSSSQSSHEAMQRTSQEFTQSPLDAPGPGMRATTSSRNSLVETLQTCLTSLPSSTNASALASPTGRSLSDHSRAAPPTLTKSGSSGALSGSTSKALGPTKTTKRRSRASRRPPTTILEATSGDFRDMVQRLTGIPAANSPAPVRPQPQRAAPTTFIRPDRSLPAASVRPAHYSDAANASILNFITPTTPPAANLASFDDILHPLNRSSSELLTPLRSPKIKRELEAGSSVARFSMSGSVMTTRSLSEPTSWWDSAAQEQSRQINLPNASLANDIITTSGPSNVASSAELTMLPEDNELSMSQFDAWLSGDDH